MVTSAAGITIPGDDPSTVAATPLQQWWNNLAKSLGGRVPRGITNTAARASYLSALAAEGSTPSTTSPVIVRQADTGEYLENVGAGWVPWSPRAYVYTARLASTALVGVSTMTPVLTLGLPADAPAGKYNVDAVLYSRSDAQAHNYRSLKVGATELLNVGTEIEYPANQDTVRVEAETFTHSGGLVAITLSLQINGGTAAWNRARPGTHLRATWLGRA